MKQKYIRYEYATITEMLDKTSVGRDGQLLFLEEKKDGRQITFDRWRQDLLETAGRFQQHSAKHIGVVCDLTYECILCMYGVIMAGKVLVALEADLPGETLKRYAEKADIDLLLYHDGMIEGDSVCCETMRIQDFLAMPAEALKEWPRWEKSREACIFFTSGTEGEPNGVLLTQRNLAFINSYSGYHRLSRSPRILAYLPLYHVFSFAALTVCIHDGCQIHLSRSIKYLAQDLQKVRPDLLTTVPMVNEVLCSKIRKGIDDSGMGKKIYGLVRLSNGLRRIGIDLRTPLFRKLRESFGGIPQLIITSGSAASVSSMEFFDDFGIVLLQVYGMTETTVAVSSNTLERNRKGSVGQPLWFNQVRIRDGEIQIRGENIMKGYYKAPRATENAFDDGWLRTGDLGYFDKDGYLHITGRKKNLIILDSGENVSPEELEKQLQQSSRISEVVVSERNKRIHAQIIAQPQPDMDEDGVKKAIQAEIDKLNCQNPVYKRIVSWELRKEPFEKTSSLKIRR
ncbi:MAG: AMP-binding protein [Oscillospiraceae bacterium]|nr:AMP-binding protein [Oscillospiraceae bacterium]